MLTFSSQDDRKKMFLYSNKETKENLRADLRHALEKANACDMKLYSKVVGIFDKELQVVQTNTFF